MLEYPHFAVCFSPQPSRMGSSLVFRRYRSGGRFPLSKLLFSLLESHISPMSRACGHRPTHSSSNSVQVYVMTTLRTVTGRLNWPGLFGIFLAYTTLRWNLKVLALVALVKCTDRPQNIMIKSVLVAVVRGFEGILRLSGGCY